jgi:5-methylthioribose kinase
MEGRTSAFSEGMREIDAETAGDYLRDSERIPRGADVRVRELGGGVSNIVLRVDLPGQAPFVLKQCRERLRVALEWRARIERIWTESATLEVLRTILPEGLVPHVLFEDRPNYLFAMTCAPDDAVTWKTHLMDVRVDPSIARRLGMVLGTIHKDAPGHPALHGILADTSLFDELRVDPYYRTAARRHPDLKPRIMALIAAMDRPPGERTLVLGDFSPKNILVHERGLVLLDFECAHAGDPAFDLGFFLSHLLLKTIHHGGQDSGRARSYVGLTQEFWGSYLDRMGLGAARGAELVQRAITHAAACCLARVDGKSPVEYLGIGAQAIARSFAREALQTEPTAWDDLLTVLEKAMGRESTWQP